MHGGAPDRARRRKKAAAGFLRSVFIRSSDGPLLRWESSSSRSAVRAAASVARSRAAFTIALSIVRRRAAPHRTAPHRGLSVCLRYEEERRRTYGNEVRCVLHHFALFSIRDARPARIFSMTASAIVFHDLLPLPSCRRTTLGKRSGFVAGRRDRSFFTSEEWHLEWVVFFAFGINGQDISRILALPGISGLYLKQQISVTVRYRWLSKEVFFANLTLTSVGSPENSNFSNLTIIGRLSNCRITSFPT